MNLAQLREFISTPQLIGTKEHDELTKLFLSKKKLYYQTQILLHLANTSLEPIIERESFNNVYQSIYIHNNGLLPGTIDERVLYYLQNKNNLKLTFMLESKKTESTLPLMNEAFEKVDEVLGNLSDFIRIGEVYKDVCVDISATRYSYFDIITTLDQAADLFDIIVKRLQFTTPVIFEASIENYMEAITPWLT